MNKYKRNDNRKTFSIETAFEKILWSSRFLILFPVIFSILGAILLFFVASYDILKSFTFVWDYFVNHSNIDMHNLVIGEIIGAIDIYLIAVILVVFSFGLYELFISKINAAENSESSNILEIHSLDVLKDKIAKVIIMALIVKFFQITLNMSKSFNSALDLVYFSAAIAGLALSLFLLRQTSHKK